MGTLKSFLGLIIPMKLVLVTIIFAREYEPL